MWDEDKLPAGWLPGDPVPEETAATGEPDFSIKVTDNDEELQDALRAIAEVWPDRRRAIDQAVRRIHIGRSSPSKAEPWELPEEPEYVRFHELGRALVIQPWMLNEMFNEGTTNQCEGRSSKTDEEQP